MSVQFANDIGLVTFSSNPAQPSVYEPGEPRPGDGIGNQRDGQNDEGNRVYDGGRGGGDTRGAGGETAGTRPTD